MVSQRNALSKLVLVAVAVFTFAGSSVFARALTAREMPGSNQSLGDADLVRAVRDGRYVSFIEGTGLKVIQVLPDDNKGLPHQLWVMQLSSGAKVQAVYNSDMGKRIPLAVGDTVDLGGEFKMTDIGPLIHWLHDDPRQQRPDGYVIHKGIRYGTDPAGFGRRR